MTDRILDPAPRTRSVPSNFAVVPPPPMRPPSEGFVSARAAKRAYRNALRLEMRDRIPDLLIGAIAGFFFALILLEIVAPFIDRLTMGGL